MQYMIMNYVPSDAAADTDQPLAVDDGPAWGAYTKALMDAGVMRGGNALKGTFSATVVRVRDGKREIHDGPYADSREQLGGYYIIEAADLDEALQWAARNPAASSGAVEVRPILTQ